MITRRDIFHPESWARCAEEAITEAQLELKRQFEEFAKIFSPIIDQELGISPEELLLFPAIRNHVVDKELMDVIDILNADIFCGELTAHDASQMLLYPPEGFSSGLTAFDRFLHAGVGATTKQIQEHVRNLQQIMTKGLSISTTDGEVDIFGSDNSSLPDIELLALGLAGLGGLLSLGSFSFAKFVERRVQPRNDVAKEASGISRRKILFLGLCMGLLAGGMGAQSYLRISNMKGLREDVPFEFDLASNDTDITLQVALEKLLKDPDFLSAKEASITLRNQNMALNIWHVCAMSSSGTEEQKRIVAMAGIGHEAMCREFLRGIDQLEQSMQRYALALATDTLDILLENTTRDAPDRLTKIVELMKGYGRAFGEVHTIRSNSANHATASTAKRIPRTARAILLSTFEAECDRLQGASYSSDEEKKLATDKIEILTMVKNELESEEQTYEQTFQALSLKNVNF